MSTVNGDIEVKRTCPDCKGHCVEDIYDPDSPPCTTCWGEGEI